MTALAPIGALKVAEADQCGAVDVAVLGRDIRTSPETIAHYCVTAHEPIYEDLATLVESMAYWDRLMVRRRASGWARRMSIELPVYELAHVPSLRVPRKFGRIRMREVSYRTHPLAFCTSAAIAAAITRAEPVVIGENGQGAIGLSARQS